MIRYIPQSILLGLKQIWDKWNIRGAILFSLLLQIVLTLVAPVRKNTRRKLVISLIWLTYLMANATANFAITLILTSQRNQSDNPERKPKSKESSDLLAFWAPFLLLHLGGPDTITAFAFEDNHLWLRHLFGLGSQAAAVLYVFFLSLPNENLWIPTTLMFVAGIIKYVERTVAFYLACLDNFRDFMLNPPNPEPNYVQLMEIYASKKKAKLPMRIHVSPRPDEEAKASDFPAKDGDFTNLEVVHYAYKLFQKFKGLIVNRMFIFRERDESRDFFNRMTAENALRIIEVELNFIYGTFYTKVAVVHSVAAYFFRFIAFGSVLTAFGIFYFQANQDVFQGVDIGITYTLLLGAIALDVIAFFMLIFSDWTFASIRDPERPRCCFMASVISGFLALKKPLWHGRECSEFDNQNISVTNYVLATPLVFRRWSGSVSAHSLVRYFLKSSSTTIHEFPSSFETLFVKIVPIEFRYLTTMIMAKISQSISLCMHPIGSFTKKVSDYMKGKINHFIIWCMSFKCIVAFTIKLGDIVLQLFNSVFKIISKPIKDLADELKYVSIEPLTKELWEFIFDELRNKSYHADTPETAKLISSARGEWVLKEAPADSIRDRSKILKYVRDVRYDESLFLWHIATDLCYYTADPGEISKDNLLHRQFSKILSDYMMYLLIFQPTIMSAVAGIAKIRFRDTCAEVERFFAGRGLRRNKDKEACQEILSVNTDVEPKIMKGEASKSVLFDASVLAKLLSEEGEDK